MNKSIIINFPTNIGDVILALPVLDKLRANFPQSRITAIASSKTKEFILRNSFIDEVVLFDKTWPPKIKRRFAFSLRGKFDIFVDLKNTFLPLVAGSKIRTPFIRRFPKNMHLVDKNLALIKGFSADIPCSKSEFILSDDEKHKWEKLNIPPSIFIACSSRLKTKCYDYDCLKQLVDLLAKDYPVVILGEDKERAFYSDILFKKGVLDLVGRTKFTDLPFLLRNYALLLIGVDSSIHHLASYLDIPVISFFGPTHPDRSYSRSKKSIILRNESLECLPCEKSICAASHECMKLAPQKVVQAVKTILK